MKKQASSRFCFVCGVENPDGLHMKFYEPGPGAVYAEIIVPEKFQGYPGIVHGGIVATMLDEVCDRVYLGDNPPRFQVTVKLSVRYRRPVPVGKKLILKGHAVQDKGRVAYAAGEIFDEDGALLAEAEVVLADIPADLVIPENSTVDSWNVYPDEE